MADAEGLSVQPVLDLAKKSKEGAGGLGMSMQQAAAGAFKKILDEFEEVKDLLREKEPLVQLQDLVVHQDALNWKEPERWGKLQKNKWPLPFEPWLDEDFVKYIKGRKGQEQPQNQAVALGKLKHLFAVEGGGDIDEQGFLVNIIRSGALEALMDMEIFSTKHPHTMVLVSALKHAAKFYRIIARRNKDYASLFILQTLTDELLDDLSKGLGATKKSRDTMALLKGWRKVENAATPQQTREAVREAMVDLHIIVRAYGGSEAMPVQARLNATQVNCTL